MATRCLVVVSQQLLPGPSELGKECPGGLKRREWGRGVAARAAQGTWGRQLERHVGVLVCLAKISLPCRLRWPLAMWWGVCVCIPEQLEGGSPGGPQLPGVTEWDPPLLPQPQAAASSTADPPSLPGCIQFPWGSVGRCGFPAGA